MANKLVGKTIQAVSFDIPAPLICSALLAFNKQLLSLPKLKAVVDLKEKPGFKRITLDHHTFKSSDTLLPILSSEQRKFIEENNVSFKNEQISLTVENVTLSELLSSVLPPHVSNVSGFSTIGHIAQLNINEEHLPYKAVIGEAVLLKNPEIKTVVAKLNNLHSENIYRTLDFEVIAGVDKTFTRTMENKFVYFLDLKKVFFNPRLIRERAELISTFLPSEVIGDFFAGVGPFSIPAAKKHCTVYANDANPDAVFYLQKNIAANKIPRNNIKIFNLDVLELLNRIKEQAIQFTHIIMNLPMNGYTFLPHFKGVFKKKEIGKINNEFYPSHHLPWIHCYGFSKSSDPLKDFLSTIESTVNCRLPTAKLKVVRTVAPGNVMVLISFPSPENFAKE